jgi:hypothetical protein
MTCPICRGPIFRTQNRSSNLTAPRANAGASVGTSLPTAKPGGALIASRPTRSLGEQYGTQGTTE